MLGTQFSGMVENELKLSSWMESLVQSESKLAMKDNLDEVANPFGLGENQIIDEYALEEQAPFYADKRNLDDSGRMTNLSTDVVDVVNQDMINTLSGASDITCLSHVSDLLTKKFGSNKALRFIKSNYNNLVKKYADDLSYLDLTTKTEPVDRSHGALVRDTDALYHSGKIANNAEKKILNTPDDIKKYAYQIMHTSSPKEVFATLKSTYGKSLYETFPTAETFKAFINKHAKIINDTIDNYARQLILEKKSNNVICDSLVKKYGEYNFKQYIKTSNNTGLIRFANSRNDGSRIDLVDYRVSSKSIKNDVVASNRMSKLEIRAKFDDMDVELSQKLASKQTLAAIKEEFSEKYGSELSAKYFKQADLKRISMFVSRNDKDNFQRVATEEKNTELKSKEIDHTDYDKLAKEAYIIVGENKTIEDARVKIESKFGSKVASTLMEKEAEGLKKVEHKLGYSYHDASLFDTCDKMASYFKGNLRPSVMLLKNKSACIDCKSNSNNFCLKTSMILSNDPMSITKRDAQRIIKAVRSLNVLPKPILASYESQLVDENNNSTIKSVLAKLKENIMNEKLASKSCSKDVAKSTGDDYRQQFCSTGMNFVNVNKLNGNQVGNMDIQLTSLI